MQKTTSNYGIGFSGLLTIAFVVLRLTNVITWSWLWVLAPAWAPFVAILLISCIGAVAIAIVQHRK